MAIMSGEIISQGSSTELVASIQGKVWGKIIPKATSESCKKVFYVISTKLIVGQTQIRLISD